jgi:hypothetical protein
MIDSNTAAAMVIPEGRNKVILQFNKITGELTLHMQWMDPATLGNHDVFTYVEDYMDFNNDVVVGNYPNYKIVAIADLPTKVYEAALNNSARFKITKAYPVIQQVNIIGRAIMALSEKAGVEQPELVELMAYIDEVRKANQARKEFFTQSPDYEYISDDDLAATKAAQLEGGVHELYGPQQAAGGVVF